MDEALALVCSFHCAFPERKGCPSAIGPRPASRPGPDVPAADDQASVDAVVPVPKTLERSGAALGTPRLPRPVIPSMPAPGRHPVGVSNEEFRAAMSRLAAGVVLVTAREPPLDARTAPGGEDVGMTATAFMSVSLDPPLVLVSLRRAPAWTICWPSSRCGASRCSSESQRHIAGRFAMKGRISDRLLFEDIPYVRGEASGAPLVGGALATLECRTEQTVPAGDHTLVIGRVLTRGAAQRGRRAAGVFPGAVPAAGLSGACSGSAEPADAGLRAG